MDSNTKSIDSTTESDLLPKKNKRFLRPFVGSKVPPIPTTPLPYPESSVSIFSRFTYSWIGPLLKTGYLRTVTADDLWTLKGTPQSIQCLYAEFEKNLEKYKVHNKDDKSTDCADYELSKNAVLRALNDTFFWQYWSAGGAKLISDTALTLNTLLTRHLIAYTMVRDNTMTGRGIGYALGVSFIFMFSAFFTNMFFYLSTTTGAQVRGVLIHAIYSKNLKLSTKSRLSFTNGKVTNLLSTDCHRVDFGLGWFHFSWTFPVSVGIAIALVLVYIGASGLIGFAVLLCGFFFTIYIGRRMLGLRRKVTKITDTRVSLMREVLQSMKIIKFYSWEDAYLNKISRIRTKEMNVIVKSLALRNVLNAVFTSIPTLAGLLSFILLSKTGGYLNPATVFSSLSIFNVLRAPLMILPLSLITSTDAYQALTRIEAFLSAPEMNHYLEHATADELNGNAIVMSDCSFIWETEDKEVNDGTESEEEQEKITRQLTKEHTVTANSAPLPIVERIESPDNVTSSENESVSEKEPRNSPIEDHSDTHIKFQGFSNISFNIKEGEFIIVTGTIGSGKSSLLSAMAGSMHTAAVQKQITQAKKSGALMIEEDKDKDGVDLEVYLTFVRYGTGFLKWAFLPIFGLTVMLATFTTVFTNTWLSFWTGSKFPGRSENFYIGIFVMLAIMSMILMFSFFFMLTVVGNRTSRKLHLMAVNRILHSPMYFFDSSPLGRILNRFTHDADTMDVELSDQARLFLSASSMVMGVFILIIIYLPWVALAVGGLFVVYLATSTYYRASAREIKRLDSLGRSKVFSHFGETLTGVSTIVAYGEQDRFLKTNEDCLNRMNAAYFLTLVNQRWLSVRLDGVGACITIVVTILCVTHQFSISPSSVGLVISSLLQIVSFMSLVVRNMATVENNMNAVERIYHYADKLETEAEFYIPETAPPPTWPSEGRITFNKVVMSYQPGLPPVLKDISFSVKKGEKIGICGRTGAGKSTIMNALYRMSELTSGSIEIDGVDISKLGLHELRSRLSIIPQDPVLFQGTVRSNIDPFEKASDIDLWQALRSSWLLDSNEFESVRQPTGRSSTCSRSIKFHLDEVVNDEGTNFSLGERQLLALARALVRNTQILILDEATSNVDFQTDNKIQTTIQSEFAHCTILCIAHRLRTIINYDRILVLEAGEVAEFDTPLNLFNNTDSVFRSMCDNSGIILDDFLST